MRPGVKKGVRKGTAGVLGAGSWVLAVRSYDESEK